MIDEAVDAQGDVFYGGYFRALETLLNDCGPESGYEADNRAVVARIGREMRLDGRWRAQVKLSGGWNGAKTAWEALAAFIAKHRNAEPWWAILEYANGEKVPESVTRFFEPETRQER